MEQLLRTYQQSGEINERIATIFQMSRTLEVLKKSKRLFIGRFRTQTPRS